MFVYIRVELNHITHRIRWILKDYILLDMIRHVLLQQRRIICSRARKERLFHIYRYISSQVSSLHVLTRTFSFTCFILFT